MLDIPEGKVTDTCTVRPDYQPELCFCIFNPYYSEFFRFLPLLFCIKLHLISFLFYNSDFSS